MTFDQFWAWKFR